MPLPDFQTIMLPLLRIAGDGKEHSIHEFVDKLARSFSLTETDLNEMLPSGKQTTFYNRVGWARTYLSKSGLLKMSKRSYYQITDRGSEVLACEPSRIDMKFLEKFPEYLMFREREGGRSKKDDVRSTISSDLLEGKKTPEEVLDDAYQEIRDNLARELLSLVNNCSPAFFERLVVELLVKMGYGGSRKEAARAVGQTGDEGNVLFGTVDYLY